MTTQQQERRPNLPQEHRHKQPLWMRWIIASAIIILIAVGTFIWILSSRGAFTTILPVVIFTVLGVLIALFQWLFPVSLSTFEHSVAHPHAPQVPSQNVPVVHQVQPIIVQVPITQPLPLPSPVPDKVSYRGIIGLPPPTDPRTIQQREQVVKEVYSKLTQPDITAIALTGIGGVGKSTLAALIYRHVEELKHTSTSPFQAETLWLTVDPSVTFADLTGNLFEALKNPMPDLGNLASQNQAVALFNALNSTDKPRLIILDQFENLLDWDTGHALTDRPGVGEWLDIINSQLCACRVLLTSRPRPVGTREYPPTYLYEYPVGGLEPDEGVSLLHNQGVQGTYEELQAAVSYCAGHAFSLTLLASLLRDHHLDLTTLFKQSSLWTGDIATNLLDQIYTQRLNDVQRKLLLAFSAYREPVPFEAANAVITYATKGQLTPALKALRTQRLLEALDGSCYQLHAIVAGYARTHIDESSERANEEALRAAHARAARYYLDQAVKNCPPREQRRKVNDVHDLIEAIWQYCQAEQWQEAYNLMVQEQIFADLHFLGGNAILLELYQLFPLSKWPSDNLQKARIYIDLGDIYRVVGQNLQALKYLEQGLHICQEAGDRKGKGQAFTSLGRVHNPLGNKNRAREYYEQALNIWREVQDLGGESLVLLNLGWVYMDLGQMDRAREYFEQGLHVCQEIGDRRREGSALYSLGQVSQLLGSEGDALKHYEKALRICRGVGYRGEEGAILTNMGLIYNMSGQEVLALKYCKEALGIAREVGDRGREGWALYNLGRVYETCGKNEYALKHYKQALRILRETGDRRAEARVLIHLGVIASYLEENVQVWAYCREGLSILRKVEDRWGEGEGLYDIGKLYLAQSDYYIALASLWLAKDILEEVRHPKSQEIQANITKIHQELGDEQFINLLAAVELQAQQIVDQALAEMQSSD